MNFDFDVGEDQEQDGPIEKEGKGSVDGGISSTMSEQTKVAPPTQDEFLWLWKVSALMCFPKRSCADCNILSFSFDRQSSKQRDGHSSCDDCHSVFQKL